VSLAAKPAAPYVLNLRHVRRAHDRIEKSLSAAEFASAVSEGERLSSQKAFELAIAPGL